MRKHPLLFITLSLITHFISAMVQATINPKLLAFDSIDVCVALAFILVWNATEGWFD